MFVFDEKSDKFKKVTKEEIIKIVMDYREKKCKGKFKQSEFSFKEDNLPNYLKKQKEVV